MAPPTETQTETQTSTVTLQARPDTPEKAQEQVQEQAQPAQAQPEKQEQEKPLVKRAIDEEGGTTTASVSIPLKSKTRLTEDCISIQTISQPGTMARNTLP
jgi:hypothetical protein